MNSMNPKLNILMYTMSSFFEWENGVVNRNRQIVETLAKDERVGKMLVVNYLPFSLKRKVREYLYSTIYQKDSNTIKMGFDYKLNQVSENLFYLSTLTDASIDVCLKFFDIDDSCIWSYNPMDIQFLKREGLKVFDAVDHWAKHPVYKNYENLLYQNYDSIIQNVDWVWTVSESIKDEFQNQLQGDSKNKIHWIPNGVNLKHYQSVGICIDDFELDKISKPIVGYIGVIQERFDLDLACYLARNNCHVSFVYIGPVWKDLEGEFNERLSRYSNVYLLGKKSYEDVPRYLQDFDIAIVPHKINEFTHSMNPMKIYEYLACGKPVISNEVAGVEAFKGLIHIAKDNHAFDNCLKSVLMNPKRREEERLNFIMEHSWEKRVDEMLEKIIKG